MAGKPDKAILATLREQAARVERELHRLEDERKRLRKEHQVIVRYASALEEAYHADAENMGAAFVSDRVLRCALNFIALANSQFSQLLGFRGKRRQALSWLRSHPSATWGDLRGFLNV